MDMDKLKKDRDFNKERAQFHQKNVDRLEKAIAEYNDPVEDTIKMLTES